MEAAAASGTVDSNDARARRVALVREVVAGGEVTDPRVIKAMLRVPRHLFVPGAPMAVAYADRPASIGYGQTISQPTTVALMTDALQLSGRERVLEIGTGSGYQAAILSLLASEVYSIEVVAPLADEASERLQRLGYANVYVRAGDGYAGWPEEAPFDRIIVTAAPEGVPRALLDQLADHGILVAPVGATDWTQRLLRCRKAGGAIAVEDLGGVSFVPMVPQR